MMNEQLSFIETQFPVSKLSKESYKERKSNNGQTLTGLGKWWGRKPLILVRAAILGCLMPASDNFKKDTEIFLKILSMDKKGLETRKNKFFLHKDLYHIIFSNDKLSKYRNFFDMKSNNYRLVDNAPREEIELAAFNTLSYDKRISMCKRPEQEKIEDPYTWSEINQHLSTNAYSLQDLVVQLSYKKFGKNIVVGDCFCGGGSIPFEAARMNCDVYASDLNPIAGLLTWSDINICGADSKMLHDIKEFQKKLYSKVNSDIIQLGVESNDFGDRAISYLYCTECKCPECGKKIPLAPNWVIGKGTKTVVKLEDANDHYEFNIKSNASAEEIKEAGKGTIKGSELVCPNCGKRTPLAAIRNDHVDSNGKVVYGLRKLKFNEFEENSEDVYHERLYAIKYEHIEILSDGKELISRYYTAPSKRDYENENKIRNIVREKLSTWQEKGLVPATEIVEGEKTIELIRNRGWKYWHHLFNPRQLYLLASIADCINLETNLVNKAVGMLGLHKCIDWNSKLCRWNSGTGNEKSEQTFYNQALNTMMNYGTRSLKGLKTSWFFDINSYTLNKETKVELSDARNINKIVDFWITDPPYADAVNYHELTEFFLAWDKKLLPQVFPDWYIDSKRILAVRGDEHFSQTMIEIYSNLTEHMSDNGMQVVMFTHSDPAIWAQLAIIMWKSGLKVTAAWNIATETDASGLKDGNYVKGTVLLVLRKRIDGEEAFLDEIAMDIKSEVKKQIDSMRQLDDKEEPNFADPDYVLAAYAASLKVLTSYESIEDLDLDYELNQAITNPSKSEIVKIIENAKKIAYDCVIPLTFSSYFWKELSNAEKFYIKGLECEKHSNYQISTYQEFARGFSVGGYSQLMASERANTARLKTPFEMAGRTFNDVPDFQDSVMRIIFQGIYVGIKEDMNPQKALGFIKNEINDYWDKREIIGQILSFMMDIKDIGNMQPHWTASSEMIELLQAALTHDSI